MRSGLIQADSELVHELAAQNVAEGKLISFLTDTFYAIGANPLDEDAVNHVAEIKGREDRKPILVLISDTDVISRFVPTLSASFNLLARHFWAGELTIVEKAKPNLPKRLTGEGGTIGLRLPRHLGVVNLLRKCGGALTATSANPAGLPPAQSAIEVERYFGDKLSLIVDGGRAKQTLPSSIVDVSGGEARLLREGVISRDELSKVISFSE